MLRITTLASPAAAKAYYQASDYYLGPEEPPGLWFGRAAERLGLRGQVEQADFHALCDNLDPRTGHPLTAARRADRDVGRDLTFSVPKSVSLAALVADDERILPAVLEAAQATLGLVEQDVRTRVRKGQVHEERPTHNLCAALFPHLTARPVAGEVDPQLHVHAVVFSLTHDAREDEFKAIHFREVVRNAPFYQAAFRADLALRLQALGYTLDARRGDFEIVGVPARVRTEFARRTALIEEKAQTLDLHSAEARARLGATTREAKQPGGTRAELSRRWHERLQPGDAHALHAATTQARERTPGLAPARLAPGPALDYALDHLLERTAAAPERQVLAETLRHGLGTVSLDAARRELHARKLPSRQIDGQVYLTTPEVLTEERRLLDFAGQGRGTCRPLLAHPHRPLSLRPGFARLSDQQRAAVEHVWASADRVVLLRGAAGTGKTTLTRAALDELPVPFVILAPTAEAGRGVLRREGFDGADTLARFLLDSDMQKNVQGGVIWLDEASLAGSRDLARLAQVARCLDARLVLAGDRRQHRAVARGDVLGLLQDHARLPVAEVSEIRRQGGSYRDAVQLLAQGRTGEGFDALDSLGWVVEAGHERLVADYLQARAEGQDCLAVSPTHAEGERLTGQLRAGLRAQELLGDDERRLPRLVPVQWTAAERGDARNYAGDEVLQFHRHAGPYRAGQRVQATPAVLAQVSGKPGAFAVYRAAAIALAAGDTVRLSGNGWTRDGRHRLHNGSFHTVAGFTAAGNVRLKNGWVVDKEFGHLDHGLVVTSHAAQGRTVDRVFIAQAAESFPACGAAQFYVSVSRARHEAHVYTDDKEALRRAVQRAEPGVHAVDLVPRPNRTGRGLRQRLLRYLTQARHLAARLPDSHGPEPQAEREVSHER